MGLFQNLFRKKTEHLYYEKRRRPRLDCSVSAEFTDFKGNIWSCRILNMSESGLGITTGAHLQIGNTVNIVRPSMEAKVVWTADNKAGLRIIT